MGQLKALIGAVIGGAVGAGIWAAVVYNMQVEIGWIAWGVGLLCGLGAALAARGDTDTTTGAVAAFVALASICGGKYLAVHYAVQDQVKRIGAIEVSEDDAKLYMADQLVDEYEKENKPIKWPDGEDQDSADELKDYPKILQSDVLARWDAMGPTEREGYIGNIRAQHEYLMSEVAGMAESESFFAMFSPLDFLFFFLALATAYKVGSGNFGGDD